MEASYFLKKKFRFILAILSKSNIEYFCAIVLLHQINRMYVFFTLKKYLNLGGWEKCVKSEGRAKNLEGKSGDVCMNGTVSDSVLQFSPNTMQWTQVKISRKLQQGLIRIL